MAPFLDIEDEPAETSSPAWLLTFIDLVSLLLTFFVLLFSMSSLKGEPWRATRATLTTVFGGHEALPQPATLRNEGWRRDHVPADLDYLAGVIDSGRARLPALRDVAVERTAEGVSVHLPVPLLFASGAPALSEEGTARLVAVARLLAPAREAIAVEARGDPGGGDAAKAWETSLARALAVARALRQAGVRAPVLARGLGDFTAFPAPGAPAADAPAPRIDVVIRERMAAP